MAKKSKRAKRIAKRKETNKAKTEHYNLIIEEVHKTGNYPTRDQILAKRTGPGGWTRADLASFGVAWPPQKGWLEELARLREIEDLKNVGL